MTVPTIAMIAPASVTWASDLTKPTWKKRERNTARAISSNATTKTAVTTAVW